VVLPSPAFTADLALTSLPGRLDNLSNYAGKPSE
jgi:hypothetical protein